MPNNEKTGASLKNNRSVRKTKTALRKGLLELMKSRSILHISVTEICDIADVGRSTFYVTIQPFPLAKLVKSNTI
jgi:AcrR family transcriptional regulator